MTLGQSTVTPWAALQPRRRDWARMRLAAPHRCRWHDRGTRLLRKPHTRAAESPSKRPCGALLEAVSGAHAYRDALASEADAGARPRRVSGCAGLFSPEPFKRRRVRLLTAASSLLHEAAWRVPAVAQGDHPPGLYTRPKPRRGLCSEQAGPGPDLVPFTAASTPTLRPWRPACYESRQVVHPPPPVSRRLATASGAAVTSASQAPEDLLAGRSARSGRAHRGRPTRGR